MLFFSPWTAPLYHTSSMSSEKYFLSKQKYDLSRKILCYQPLIFTVFTLKPPLYLHMQSDLGIIISNPKNLYIPCWELLSKILCYKPLIFTIFALKPPLCTTHVVWPWNHDQQPQKPILNSTHVEGFKKSPNAFSHLTL